jgi:hypothetical protein
MARQGSIGGRGVCVLGFHRSGTSVAARVLNLLGVDLGPSEDLLDARDDDNPTGYWEPRWLNELNDELLAAIGGDAWQPLQAELGWESRPELEPLRKWARERLDRAFGNAALWGWKDPRTSLTFPFWKGLASDLWFVVCVRSPSDAVDSAVRRGAPSLSRFAWGQLWLEYTARAMMHSDPERRILVFYEDLIADPQKEVLRLAAFLGDESLADPAAVGEAVRRDLQHHRTSAREVAGDSGLPIEARVAYLALRAAGADNTDELLRGGLERVVGELWTAHNQAADLRAALEEDTWAAERLRRELEQLQKTHAQVTAELADTRHQLGTILGSHSWRATAPLRAGGRWIRERPN